MNTTKHINLSIQDTLRLIAKMLEEGHTPIAAGLSPHYLTEAANTIDTLTNKLNQYQPDREMYD